MEELKTQLEAHETVWGGQPPSEPDDFTKAAQKWAAHCLATYVDDHLRKGLAIAAAMAEFASVFYKEANSGS